MLKCSQYGRDGWEILFVEVIMGGQMVVLRRGIDYVRCSVVVVAVVVAVGSHDGEIR